jgi:uncharacterized protein (TIGR02646 family)
MIKTLKIKEPVFFKSKQAKLLNGILINHFSKQADQRRQSKFPISEMGEKLSVIKKELLLKTTNKCAYCESLLNTNNTTLDHFRPLYSAADISGKISQEHYWWLAMKWNNLLPVCQQCNSQKSNFFPTEKKRVSVHYYGKKTLFDIEKPLLIDPEFEDPERYYYYDDNGFMLSYNKRGQHSIKILGLNRRELIVSRKEVIREVLGIIHKFEMLALEKTNIQSPKYQNQLTKIEEQFLKNNLPYQGARKHFVRIFFKDIGSQYLDLFNDNFKKKISIRPLFEKNYQNEEIRTVTNFELDKVSIKNYKSINDLSITFGRTKKGDAGWAILIGENGVGKSSTLTAVLKALIGRDYKNIRFNKTEINRKNSKGSLIKLSFKNKSEIARIDINNKVKYNLPREYFINSSIIAFGPYKHSNENDFGYKNFIGGSLVDNFFYPERPLHHPLKFILKLSADQFNYVSIALLDLLMLEDKASIHMTTDNSQVYIQHYKTKKIEYFNELSDGYKSVITLGCNIIEGLLINNESIENASGFVVIDEIGANLHPRWKMQIVKRLRRTFPNVQFLVTTHDPLCLKGIEENETYVLKSRNDELEVLTDLPNPSEFRADQLLTSEFFGLFSTSDPEIEDSFKEYYKLLYKGKDSLNVDDQNRFENLKKELKDKNHLGDTFREELLYIAIDEILAEQKKSKKPFFRKEVEREVKEKAIGLIDEFLSDLGE